ncbi:MAG: hypothetical protein ACJ797_08490 [Ktedonobacteraceae bacterium]
MTIPPAPPDDNEPQDAAYWARISLFQVTRVPTGALNLNVEGRRVVGPLQGFGQMWQRTYRLHIPAVNMTPAEVMQIWKANFVQFLPPKNRFYPVAGAIDPGDVLLINADFSGMPISTGVMVLYADEESLTLMTPQGHPESGWNTFSVYTSDDELICQIQSIARANDPLYEFGFRLLGSSVQERIWAHVLKALEAHLQVEGQLSIDKVCVDPRVQWSEARNVWQNAALRTLLYTLGAPLRWLSRRLSRRKK